MKTALKKLGLILLAGPLFTSCTSNSGGAATTWRFPSTSADFIGPAGFDAETAQAASAARDKAVVVWNQTTSGSQQIFIAQNNNGVWTTPSSETDNISPDGQNATAPRVAMDSSGNIIVVWQQSDGARDQIFKSEYRNGVWTHPASLADNISPDGQNAGFPEVAMDNAGNAIIVWYQTDGVDYHIYKSEYRGGAWTHPANLADFISVAGSWALWPKVAMDSNGTALITWLQDVAGDYHVFLSEYRGGVWVHPGGTAAHISPSAVSTIATPLPVLDNSGRAVIVWTATDGANDQVYKSEYRNSAWAHPALPNDNISPDGFNVTAFNAAMSADGSAIIAWTQDNGGTGAVLKAEYRADAWTLPALADNIMPANVVPMATAPALGMDVDGSIALLWLGSDISLGYVYKAQFKSGSWTLPTSASDAVNPGNVAPSGIHLSMNSFGQVFGAYTGTDTVNIHTYKFEYK